MVIGVRSRRGQSSTMKMAVATAMGTPMISAIADVAIEPKTSGNAPKCRAEGFQSLLKT